MFDEQNQNSSAVFYCMRCVYIHSVVNNLLCISTSIHNYERNMAALITINVHMYGFFFLNYMDEEKNKNNLEHFFSQARFNILCRFNGLQFNINLKHHFMP